jgi:hypothetical protein
MTASILASITFLGELLVEFNRGLNSINTIIIPLTNNKMCKGHRTIMLLIGRGNNMAASKTTTVLKCKNRLFSASFLPFATILFMKDT